MYSLVAFGAICATFLFICLNPALAPPPAVYPTAQQEIDQVATLNIALLDFCVGFGEVRRQDF